MTLKELLKHIQCRKVAGPLDREVTGVTHDSRRVFPGMLFVAMPGLKTDGHDYIQTAVERGAVAVVCQRNGFGSTRAAQIQVEDSADALAQLSAAFFDFPSRRLKMIGITGTNGKTTVSFLIKHMLERAGIRCGLMGTVRYEIGDRMIPAQRTTPEAPDIHQMLAQMVNVGCQACVMEVSSHALTQKRVAGIHFDLGVFTNLTHDHLDYHGDIESYFNAKKTLFTSLSSAPGQGALVTNSDDPYGARLAVEVAVGKRLTYGLAETADLRARAIELGRNGTQMMVWTGEMSHRCQTNLIGRHNVYNALAAIGTGLSLGIDSETLCSSLRSADPVPGRLEQVPGRQPFGVYVDYAHTDDALANVLKTLREITPGRVLLTFGCGGDRDPTKRSRMGRIGGQLADVLVLTSDNPRREAPETIAAEILVGAAEASGAEVSVELDRRRAIDRIIRKAQPGDSVIIAGKGHETYQEFEDTVVPFDDRLCARETLEVLGWRGAGRG